MKQPCLVKDLGVLGYEQGYAQQMRYLEDARENKRHYLLLCEHSPVITLGRSAHRSNILAADDLLTRKGVEVVSVDRGGDVTLHLPGQLVVYPVFCLEHFQKDLHLFLRQLEKTGIDFLKGFDIVANRFEGKTGVFVAGKKIISIGIGVKRWISYHGMSINIGPDLGMYSFIRPCGLDVEMTSVVAQGRPVSLAQAKERIIHCFQSVFGLELIKGI